MTDELRTAQADLQLLRLNFDRLAESSEELATEIERLRTAGKAALDDIDGGNDASAHLILKHNFGKADG